MHMLDSAYAALVSLGAGLAGASVHLAVPESRPLYHPLGWPAVNAITCWATWTVAIVAVLCQSSPQQRRVQVNLYIDFIIDTAQP